jgi:GntR family transcriptional regulator
LPNLKINKNLKALIDISFATMIAELKINKNLKIPYYYQLYENIVESIEKNFLSEGDRLFGEIQLCEKYDVSRITVRQALKELEVNGYIVRERGKGTFIRKKIETHSLQKVSSIVDELRNEGIKTSNKILENKIMVPDEKILKILEIGSDSKILFVKRIIYAYGAPLYMTKAYLPYDLTGRINKSVLTGNSFTNIITKVLKIRLTHSKRVLEPAIPDDETAALLNIDNGSNKIVHYLQTFWTLHHSDGPRTIYFEEFFNPANGKFVFEKDY